MNRVNAQSGFFDNVSVYFEAEYEGAIHNPKGLDVEAVMKHRKETGSLPNFPGATNLNTREDALELDCDILIPAALENQITEENAGRVKAKILAEAANGLTPVSRSRWLLRTTRFGRCGKQIRRFRASGQQPLQAR